MPKKPMKLTAKLHVEYKDDPETMEKLLNILCMALDIADMDKEQAKKYQENFLDRL